VDERLRATSLTRGFAGCFYLSSQDRVVRSIDTSHVLRWLKACTTNTGRTSIYTSLTYGDTLRHIGGGYLPSYYLC
jgi:hypothetical protein